MDNCLRLVSATSRNMRQGTLDDGMFTLHVDKASI